MSPAQWRRFGAYAPEPPPDDAAGAPVAIEVVARDGFADPPGLTVRADVLAQVGEPAQVRAGALADLLARIEAAGHATQSVHVPVTARRVSATALRREGSARLWLWRRHPARHPLPRPAATGPLRFAVMALGALHANGEPTRPR